MGEVQTMELDGATVTYLVTSVIDDNNQAATRFATDDAFREKMKSLGIRRIVRMDPKADVYPAKLSYTFQEFAGAVFEIGGFGDMTLINPYTLQRLWVGDVFGITTTVYEGMTRVIAIAKALDFLGEPPEDKN